MELGIFSRTYETADLRETLREMTSQGIYHTQFNLSNAGLPTLPEFIDEKKIEEIKKLTKEFGVTLDALSGTFNMIDPDEEARQKGCDQFAVQCEIAELLEIPIVTLCTGSKNPKSKWEWHDDNEKPSSWDDLMRTTDTILKYAEDRHIILGVETEASNIICSPEKARKYLDEAGSRNLKIIMDGANLFHPSQVPDMEKVLTESFEILGKDIVLAHAKDFSFDGSLEFVAAGEGVLDFALYVKLLRQYGYDKALVMHGLSVSQVEKSAGFLKEMITHA